MMTIITMNQVYVYVYVHAAPLHDLISELPGYGRLPTPYFSGYLDASDMIVTQK